ncbi:DNA-binding response regulator ['Osedax' symbiont bacterium Rs2_46_30_T18]|nr:DNA-binding response regulator ['Osedax' symbiont bacterium Rs2_46_30_T18]
MNRPRIVLVEDNQLLSESIAEYLEIQGYSVCVESNGILGERRILSEQPELVILDLMLPGKDGVSICRDIRAQYSGYILMFTAKEEEIDQIIGLEIGADDYLIKPVKPRLLLAKIKAFLRRTETVTAPESLLNYGALEIDAARRTVSLAQREIDITAAEFEVLLLLAKNAGEILSRDYIAQNIRGLEHDGLERSTDNRISQLRKKLDDDARAPKKIKTIRSKGYVFIASAW